MESINKFFDEHIEGTRQLRDFIDLDGTFRSINGEQENFEELPIKDEEIFNDEVEEDNNDSDSEKENTKKMILILKL